MLIKIKYIIKDFLRFLKYPSLNKNEKISFFYYLMVFAIVMLASGIIRIGVPIVFTLLNVPVIENLPSSINSISLIWFFILAVIIAPLVEEWAFRYPLKYTKNSLFIGWTLWIIIVTFTNLNSFSKWISIQNFSIDIFKPVFWYYIALAVLIFIITRFKQANNFLSKYWNKYLILIVYVLAAYFAYNHMPISKTGVNWLWLPILIFPQFCMALYLSYIRLQVKFLYCIFLHVILNGFTMIPFLLNI